MTTTDTDRNVPYPHPKTRRGLASPLQNMSEMRWQRNEMKRGDAHGKVGRPPWDKWNREKKTWLTRRWRLCYPKETRSSKTKTSMKINEWIMNRINTWQLSHHHHNHHQQPTQHWSGFFWEKSQASKQSSKKQLLLICLSITNQKINTNTPETG